MGMINIRSPVVEELSMLNKIAIKFMLLLRIANVRLFIFLYLSLSIACTYQSDRNKKENNQQIYEKGFISYYKSDTTSRKVIDTAFIFKTITDSMVMTEYRTGVLSDTTYFGFSTPIYTDDYILFYEDTCKFMFRDTIKTTPTPMKILIYGHSPPNSSELPTLLFADDNKNIFLIFDMHYFGKIFLHKNQLKNTDIQLIIDKTREIFFKM